MLVEQEVRVFSTPVDALFKNLVDALERSSWRLVYTDAFETDSGDAIRLIYGLSGAFSGSNLLSVLNEGARYIPFLVKIAQLDDFESEVLIIVSGATRLGGNDYGRNRAVIKKILRLCA